MRGRRDDEMVPGLFEGTEITRGERRFGLLVLAASCAVLVLLTAIAGA